VPPVFGGGVSYFPPLVAPAREMKLPNETGREKN